MDVAAALVALGAARLDMDQTEARLLDAAQASTMGWEQIAAILGLTVEENRGTAPAAQTPPRRSRRPSPPTTSSRPDAPAQGRHWRR